MNFVKYSIDRESVYDLIVERTLEFQNLRDSDEEPQKFSEKALAIRETILAGEFGCQTNDILRIFSILLDEQLPPGKEDGIGVLFKPYIMVSVNANTNSHNYLQNTPILLTSSYNGGHRQVIEDSSNLVGNNVPYNIEEYNTLTEEEIREYLSSLSDNDLRFLLEGIEK